MLGGAHCLEVSIHSQINQLSMSRSIIYYQKHNKCILYLKKDLTKLDQLPMLDEMALKPKANDKKQITFSRVAALVALFFCLFVLITEATVIYEPQKTLMYIIVEDHPTWKYRNFVFSIVFLACVDFVCFGPPPQQKWISQNVTSNPKSIMSKMKFDIIYRGASHLCFFTIFNSRVSDFFQLEVKHTDCLRLSSVVAWCCKIITISCWNYMVIIGEVAPGMEEYQFGTCYADFYSSVIKLPFLGSYFNTIMLISNLEQSQMPSLYQRKREIQKQSSLIQIYSHCSQNSIEKYIQPTMAVGLGQSPLSAPLPPFSPRSSSLAPGPRSAGSEMLGFPLGCPSGWGARHERRTVKASRKPRRHGMRTGAREIPSSMAEERGSSAWNLLPG